MSNETERPEDTIRRFAGQIQDLEAWKRKYGQAADLWDSLGLRDDQIPVGALLILKSKDFDKDRTCLHLSRSDDVDWVDKIGLLRTATIMVESEDADVIGNN